MTEQAVTNLTYGLVLLAVGAVEPKKAKAYTYAMKSVHYPENRVSVTVVYWLPLIRELRMQKRIPTADVITKIAEGMISLSDEELVNAMVFFYDEIQLNDLLLQADGCFEEAAQLLMEELR